MSKWKEFKFNLLVWGVPVGAMSFMIGLIIFVIYSIHHYETTYDYKVKVMDSRDGTTYYCNSEDIEIVDGILFIKPDNITTTQFVITKLNNEEN